MTRYFFVILLMALIGVAIVVKAGITMFAERQYWQDVADRFVKDAARGHIDTPALDLIGRGFGSSYIRSRDMFDMTRPRWADQPSSKNSGS